MVVKSERTGERPETVEIAGTDVWLRRGIAEGEREEQGGEGGSVKVKVFTYEELHFTDPTGELTVDGAKADFDTVWAAHEADGMSMEEQIASLQQQVADSQAALLELGDIVGGEIYYRAVKSGKRTLESVPERWRDEVRQMLEADGE